MRALIYAALICINLSSIAFAKDFADTFLRLSPDAISRAIGGPNQAYSVGAVDIFINPALLSKHPGKKIQFSSLVNSDFFQYVNGAISFPLSRREQLGIGLIWTSIPDIQEFGVDELYPSEYDNSQLALFIGYSYNFSQFSIGVNYKYLRLGFSNSESSNIANVSNFDAGLKYDIKKNLALGFVFQNGSDINWRERSRSSVPWKIGAAMAWTPTFFSKDFLKILSGIEQFETEQLQLNLGMIMRLFQNKTTGLHDLNIRLGYGNYDLTASKKNNEFDQLTEWERDFRVGAGLHLGIDKKFDLGIDYCFQIDKDLDNQHIVTTSLRF